MDYSQFPVFKHGDIIQNCIESLEFDSNLLQVSDAGEGTEHESDSSDDFDPIYNRLLTADLPAPSTFETLRRELQNQVLSRSQEQPKQEPPSIFQELAKSDSMKTMENFKQQPPPVEKVPVKLEKKWSSSPIRQTPKLEVIEEVTLPESPKQPPVLPMGRGKREPPPGAQTGFLTAKDALIAEVKKDAQSAADYKAAIRHLGLAKPSSTKFMSPLATDESAPPKMDPESDPVDGQLKGIDEKLLERIKNDVIEAPSSMSWNDIKGLEFAKTVIHETIIYPIRRPDLFKGLRRPPKGVLLFGPPGNGKTLIAKCIASTAAAMFFNISASSLTSKWIGEGEMLVRALFTYAKANQPAVVFIDEVDSLLSRRSENEHESSRRLKTEFLVFLDGAGTGDDERILIIGATNRPQELDEAVRRRFTKRLYISLPNEEARRDIITHHLRSLEHELREEDIDQLARDTDGFSGADIKSLAQEASMIPMREMMKTADYRVLDSLQGDDIPLVGYRHFKLALEQTRPSVSEDDIKEYVDWNKKYGSGQ